MRIKETRRGSLFPMMIGNLDSWLRSPRTLLMMLFSLGTTFVLVTRYGNTIQFYSHSMNYVESLSIFVMSGFNGLSMASITFLIMVSEVPRRIAFQQYCVIRSNRVRWAVSQILYCLVTVLFMMFFLVLIASILLLPYSSEGSGWSDTLRIAAGMDPDMAYVPEWIRNTYTPTQALALALVPLFFFWFTMVLVIMLFSILGKPSIGIAIYSVILFASLIFPFELFPQIDPPTTFATLIRIGYNHEEHYALRLQQVFIGYVVLTTGLIWVIMSASKRIEIPTYSMHKQ